MDERNSGDTRPQGYWRINRLFPELGELKLEQLEQFYSQLIKLNGRLNLISKRTELDADILHIADSVLGGRIVLKESKAATIYDIGCGNGLPGIVMAVLAPERSFAIVEHDESKCEFLKIIVSRLNLKNVVVMRTRFESLAPGSIECAVSRGFATLTKALILARRPISNTGEYFHFKGGVWVREISDIPSQIISQWVPKLVAEYSLPELGGRMAIVSTKHK